MSWTKFKTGLRETMARKKKNVENIYLEKIYKRPCISDEASF